jgi:hypothetical protein
MPELWHSLIEVFILFKYYFWIIKLRVKKYWTCRVLRSINYEYNLNQIFWNSDDKSVNRSRYCNGGYITGCENVNGFCWYRTDVAYDDSEKTI